MKGKILFLLAVLFCLLEKAGSQTIADTNGFKKLYLYSSYLQQEQKIWIHLPESWHPDSSYAVMYLLDADGHFNYTRNYIDYLAKPFAKKIPPLILVGIRSLSPAYRLKNFTPPDGSGKTDRGGAPTFTFFLEKELIPLIEKTYRCTGERIIGGHSLAGLFCLYVVGEKKSLFHKVISISPSLTFGEQVFFTNHLSSFRQNLQQKSNRLYFSVADDDNKGYMEACTRLLDSLKEDKFLDLHYEFEVVARSDHYSVAPVSFYRGLQMVFRKP